VPWECEQNVPVLVTRGAGLAHASILEKVKWQGLRERGREGRGREGGGGERGKGRGERGVCEAKARASVKALK
jgi:hypothetical protein